MKGFPSWIAGAGHVKLLMRESLALQLKTCHPYNFNDGHWEGKLNYKLYINLTENILGRIWINKTQSC